ncbi:alpha/beta hydrolase [Parendozoicomonas sp. Alg238-R29]|uniref:alpha/beta fold hydrolase n=1 Tax=Parendozoicomonas sp. Alg238-R29 TaxID=2993446 RepID=UPI00248D97E2|nr:alpha/beta hydrolase [Parendozoicomonas sp. Alg238-R29]
MMPTVSRRDIQLDNKPAHYFSLEGENSSTRPVHVYHANAYPFRTYGSFLDKLDGDIFGLSHRGTWESAGLPDKSMHWHIYADDLICFLEGQNKGPVVGIGHSLGAVATTFAAAKRPDLFSALVLIDPVFITTTKWLTFRSLQKLSPKINPMAAIADRRPNFWNSRQEAVDFHQPKKAFSAFTPEAMSDFGDFGISERSDGFGLAYPREWEAHNYRTVPYVWAALKSLTVPVMGIRGATSGVLVSDALRKWQKIKPEHQLIELEGAGHMVPQEAPQKCSEVINRFINAL